MKILIFGKADFDVVQLKEKLKVELKETATTSPATATM